MRRTNGTNGERVGEILITTSLIFCLAACGGRSDTATPAPPSVPGKLTIVAPTPSDSAHANGVGIPAGYTMQLDDPQDSTAPRARYHDDGNGRWEVTTGPAHILYTTRDTTRKNYTVTATFEQLAAPEHPEAFGVFIGGTTLDKPNQQRYTYFLVRGSGEYAVKVRDGQATRTLTEWTPHPAIPKQDASGHALYGIKIDVAGTIAKVNVNGQPVTMFSAPHVPMQGIAGVRINHNLHVMVTPALVTRRN